MCLVRCVCCAVFVVGFRCRGVHHARWSTAACLQCWKVVALFVVGAICERAVLTVITKILLRKMAIGQVLDNNFPLQSTLTSFVV